MVPPSSMLRKDPVASAPSWATHSANRSTILNTKKFQISLARFDSSEIASSRVIVYQRVGQMKTPASQKPIPMTQRHGKTTLGVYVQAVTPWVVFTSAPHKTSREAGRN